MVQTINGITIVTVTFDGQEHTFTGADKLQVMQDAVNCLKENGYT